MKQCIKCSVDLVVGDNWLASKLKISDHICNPCNKIRNNKWFIENKKRHRVSVDRWAINNPEKVKKGIQKLNKTISAGVYGIYNNNELIYIGQSKKPYIRKVNHFSKQGIQGGKCKISPIAISISNGELERDNLVFKMLEFVDDPQLRLDIEQRLIQRHTPIYNEVYV